MKIVFFPTIFLTRITHLIFYAHASNLKELFYMI